MKKYTTSDRLKQLMQERGLRQADILEKCKPFSIKYGEKPMTRPALSQYVSGKVQPKQTSLFILAKALDVPEAWLMGFDDVPCERTGYQKLPPNTMPMPDRRPLPIIGDIACGTPILADENIRGYAQVPSHIKADFCLRCKGDSMKDLRIMDGDIVYICKQPAVNNGQVAAVRIGDEATLKRVLYYPDRGILVLKAANSAYEDMIYTGEELNEIEIVGLAVGFTSVKI